MPCYTGIDAHKADLHTTVLEEDGEEVDHFTIANEATGFIELNDRLDPDGLVGIEASTVCYPVVEHLLREGLTVRVGHPKKLAKLMDPITRMIGTAGTSRIYCGLVGFPLRTILIEIGPVERFDNLGTFRGYVGSAPRVRQSGETEHVDGERSSSNRRVKAVLGRATQQLIASGRDNPIKAYYHKQRDNSCTKKQAKAQARGKLSNSVYAMLREGEPCEWSDPEFPDRKLMELERAATAARA